MNGWLASNLQPRSPDRLKRGSIVLEELEGLSHCKLEKQNVL
jgi:hypothetical protein